MTEVTSDDIPLVAKPWVNLVRLIGIPSAVLVFVGWGLVSIAHWLGPKIDQGFTSHIELTRAVQKNSADNTIALDKMADAMQTIAAAMDRLSRNQTSK